MDIDEKVDMVNSKVDDLNHMIEDQFQSLNSELINIQRGSNSNFQIILQKSLLFFFLFLKIFINGI